jgi:hypothetical protein
MHVIRRCVDERVGVGHQRSPVTTGNNQRLQGWPRGRSRKGPGTTWVHDRDQTMGGGPCQQLGEAVGCVVTIRHGIRPRRMDGIMSNSQRVWNLSSAAMLRISIGCLVVGNFATGLVLAAAGVSQGWSLVLMAVVLIAWLPSTLFLIQLLRPRRMPQ